MKIIDTIDRIFISLGMIALFSIMVIVAIDGLLRQFLDAPIKGAYLLVEKYLMVAMIFPAIGYTWSKKGHIAITLVSAKMPKAAQNIIYLIIILMALFIIGIIGYTGFEKTFTAYTDHHTTSGLVRWPYWVAYIWVPIGSLLFFIRLVVEFILGINRIFKNGLNNILINEEKKELEED